MKLDIPFPDEVCEFTELRKQPLTSLELRIIERFGKIQNKFQILHHGWEMDSYGYVVTDGSSKKLIVTNHSRPVEMTADYLRHKIKEYENAIEQTKNIINLIENGKTKI
jgi:hypothetical protein